LWGYSNLSVLLCVEYYIQYCNFFGFSEGVRIASIPRTKARQKYKIETIIIFFFKMLQQHIFCRENKINRLYPTVFFLYGRRSKKVGVEKYRTGSRLQYFINNEVFNKTDRLKRKTLPIGPNGISIVWVLARETLLTICPVHR
jgi:hypothetical protein